jgi:hypothetical protein
MQGRPKSVTAKPAFLRTFSDLTETKTITLHFSINSWELIETLHHETVWEEVRVSEELDRAATLAAASASAESAAEL